MNPPDPDQATQARDALAVLAVTAKATGENCIDDHTLLEWHEGTLAGAQATRVKHHVANCDRCFELWCELCEALPRPALAPSLVERLRAAWSDFSGWQPLAAAAFVVLLGVGLGDRLMRSGPPERVAYELSVQGGATWRSDVVTPAGEPVSYAPGDRFELLLRPATATDQATSVMLIHVAGQTPTPLPVPAMTPMPEGALLIRATVGDQIQLPAGDATLVVIAGPQDALPSVSDALRALNGATEHRTADWQAWQIPVRVLTER